MDEPKIDLTGKVCLVTGATSGIGNVTARRLAAAGAELFLVCRNRVKGEQVAHDIESQTGWGKVKLLIGDLSSLEEVAGIARSFSSFNKPLHLLLNNAGVFNLKRVITADNHEEMFAVNHLSHFLLTNLLLRRLTASAPARVVNVASGAHMLIKGINFDDLNFEHGFRAMKVYSHSKLANMLFSRELAQRLTGSGVTSNAVHPGEVATGLGAQNGWTGRLINSIMKVFLQSPEKGARASFYASTSPDLHDVSGRYFGDGKELTPRPWALDDVVGRRLWDVSEAMTKL